MNSSNYRRPGAFSPRRPSSPGLFPAQSRPQSSGASDLSDSSSSSQVTAHSRETRSPQPQQQSQLGRPFFASNNSNSSTSSVNNFSRPSPNRQFSSELPLQTAPQVQSHRRQHSQGFFEPSLPSATLSDQSAMANLSASQIAAQAAMQHQTSSQQHGRQRSITLPSPNQSPPGTISGRRKPPPIQTVSSDNSIRKVNGPQTPGRQYYNGAIGGHSAAATTAANVAFPRSAHVSPVLPAFEVPEKEHKLKTERSKMKLFSKPKSGSSKDAEKERPLPSPNKIGTSGPSGLKNMVNPSVTSLADSLASGASSIYSTSNASTSTLVPTDRQTTTEKEKAHKHHFLSRQKNKLKDKIVDDHTLPLSSASSNSKPLDPSAPSSLYSFAPAPASPASSSFSGLDLRHGGRALREKKKEEKALPYAPPFAPKKADIDRVDWATGGALSGTVPTSTHGGEVPNPAALQGFGLNNMRPEDVWDFLKAKLLITFENEELRIPVEDLNRLVTVHIQRCILKRVPTIITEDLRDLLQTGFRSLDHTLRGVPDHRLVPHLVEMWIFVFGNVLPYMQAVFLPLDLEFKGHGTLMGANEAADFWGANPDSTDHALGNEFDVRRIVLLSYRDNVILAHYEALKATFSRLSLDSINVGVSPVVDSFDGVVGGRPGTAASLDPGVSSFNSQGSTLLDDGGRSRAASNLSAPELPSFGSPSTRNVRPQGPPDSSQVTETVGRMLQCVSVLASVQSGDDAQGKMEDLAKALKLNWLGRGRTGRNRRGFVGGRVKIDRQRSGEEAGRHERSESRL
ncbi:hypothetical protein OEA41_006484 [Lepraria neglecta]|uniref:HbrB-like protein n=1 Tax=Lepraria neglecta TaxID=209136 RepID=A0AAE0DKZ5_9LECA|nr:hypothetical protein OEA41_006484 [Lepraria neglecta]